MSERLIIPLDPESVRRIIGSPLSLLEAAPGVEELGDNYAVISVPRILGFGKQRLKVKLSVYETEETMLIIMGRDVDRLIVVVHVIDTGEGSHVVVSSGGSGRLARLATGVSSAVSKAIQSRLEAARPQVEIHSEDNSLAKLEKPLPPEATLVYYDSFTPVRDVPYEAALRVVALLGLDDYLVEVADYYDTYTLRLVLRGNKVTGAHVSRGSLEAVGEQAVNLARNPPGYRVRIRAWSLTGKTRAFIFEPELIAGGKRHGVYRLMGRTQVEYGGLAPNMYMVVSSNEVVVIDPVGDEHVRHAVRLLIHDVEQVKKIVVTSIEAGVEHGVRVLADVLPRATIVSTAYWASQISSLVEATMPVEPLPLAESKISVGSSELLLIPSRARGVPSLSVYDEKTKTLITGPSIGVVTPPGVWAVRIDSIDEYMAMIKSYVKHTVWPQGFLEWLEKVSKLEVERIAPRYGPVIEGQDNVSKLFNELRKMFS